MNNPSASVSSVVFLNAQQGQGQRPPTLCKFTHNPIASVSSVVFLNAQQGQGQRPPTLCKSTHNPSASVYGRDSCHWTRKNCPLRENLRKRKNFIPTAVTPGPTPCWTSVRSCQPALRGRPPRRPFRLAAATLAALLDLPPNAPSRPAIQLRDPSNPNSTAGRQRSASTFGK